MSTHDTNTGILASASDSDPPNDLLSDVLRFVQLKGERVFAMELRQGFDVLFEAGPSSLHVVQAGGLRVDIVGVPSFVACTGDVLVFPHSAEYTLSDRAKHRSNQSGDRDNGRTEIERSRIVHGEGSVVGRTISATFLFENREGVASLLSFLPSVIHIAHNDESVGVIRDVAQFLVIETESQEPGAALMISRVIDILVIRCIRTWARTMEARHGWVGALADARMSRVVAAMHRDPARDWSLSELASLAGMSRSSFAERFLSMVGEPALRYLHRWRLAMAADLLRNTNQQVQEVAHSVGYESEAAFSRAYKAIYGVSPRGARSATGIGAISIVAAE